MNAAAQRAAGILPAVPSNPTCDYLLVEPGQLQRRCGAPAAWYRHGRAGLFHYCDTCARRAEHLCRGKITLHPVKEGM